VRIIPLGVAIAVAAASVHAAEADTANVVRIYRDSVEPARQQAYEAAVRKYNKCLGQHGFKYSWRTWTHETGDTHMYSFAAGPYTWADFDTLGATDKACEDTWRTQGNPNMKDEISLFLVAQPELSRMPDADKPALINVTSFKLRSGRAADDAFTEAMRKIGAAAETSRWPTRYTLYKTRGGDRDVPDYILVSPYKNWAEYGAGPDPSVWKMVESVYGKKETEALRKQLDEALADVYSHVDNFSVDLSYIAPGK